MNRNGFVFKEEESEISLIVKTLSPEKWLLIDRETGQVYQGNPGGFWDKLKTVQGVMNSARVKCKHTTN
jgi:hypothetical protein